jgi:outer membrane lipoprotein-sorting protein
MEQRRKTAVSLLRFCILAAIPLLFLMKTATAASLDTPAVKIDPFEVISMMEKAYEKVNDYTALYHKGDHLRGEVLPEEIVYIKFKKPFKMYMKWLKGPHEGREAIYVHGMNKNKMIGHEGGLLGVLNWRLDPRGKIAMRGQLHPVTDLGVGRLIEIIAGDAKKGAAAKELKLIYLGEEEIYGRKVWHIRMELPPKKDYYSPMSDGWIDEESHLPLKAILYGPKGEFIESFGYSDLKLNPGLSDAEFDKDYKEYDF